MSDAPDDVEIVKSTSTEPVSTEPVSTEPVVRRPADLDEAFAQMLRDLHGFSMHYATGANGPMVLLSDVETLLRDLESDVRRLAQGVDK